MNRIYDARLPAGVLLAVIVLSALLLVGCATPPQTQRLSESAPASLPARVELGHVPFFPQEAYQCGPAALATLLNETGVDIEPEALVPEVYLPERRGSLQTELLAAARARGLVAYRLAPELEDVLREVAAGHPVLVFQNLGLQIVPRWHYAVVIGYDLPGQEIILRSGTIERHVNSFSLFERTWLRAGRWAFVTVRPDRLPATARPLTWLQAANALESTGQTDAAAMAYETAIQQWPEHPVGWMGLGNLRHEQKAYAAAEAAFRGLIRRQPEAHAAWNNLAYVLEASFCGKQARAAAACALRLDPENPGYLNTRANMRAVPDSGDCDQVSCPVPR